MSLAVMTMVFDDTEFLPIWVRYWAARVDRRDMYVIVHGGNAELETVAEGCTVMPVHRPPPAPNMEWNRWQMLGHLVSGLTYMYDTVLYNDVDEILVLDPAEGDDIVAHIAQLAGPVTVPVGVEVMHRSDESAYDPEYPVLNQRRFVRGNTSFGKPCLTRAPIAWRRGGHYAYADSVTVDRALFNFHLRYFDQGLFLDRARRRRATTDAPNKKDETPARRWRRDEDALKAHVSEIDAMPVEDTAGFEFERLLQPIESKARAVEADGGVFLKYPLRKDTSLRVLPERFRGLF